ncbi:MAG: sigma 54-interacting transcriptional regulator [Peptococcaceae bacterium]|nr:sigma 54-interacting transcriptional regulator [Peptococcaceae bacterium]
MRVCNQETINKYKQALICGDQINDKEIYKPVLDSWLRSRNNNININIKSFPSECIDRKTLDRINDITRYRLERNLNYYNKKNDLIDQIGAAIFYLDTNMSVFNKAGNQRLLKELKSKGIKFGTTFSESLMGTNAAVLASQQQGLECVIGEEHYCEALTEYVSVAFSAEIRYLNTELIQVFILPLSNYHALTISVLDYIYSSELFHMSYVDPEDISIKNEIINLNIQNNQSLFLIVDANGIILDINEALTNTLNVNSQHCLGKSLSNVFPELKMSLSSLKTQKPLSMVDISFQRPTSGPKDYLMDSTPIIKNNSCIGMVITLVNKKRITKYLGNLVNDNAHYSFDDLIGNSPDFLSLKALAKQAAQSPSNILLFGESGTGKELFAQAIHNESPRRKYPFIALNCAAIPKELIGSELFGYVEGAFTGAKKGGSAGKFELANCGTLFLDEIAEMPLDMQSVLLRVLEEHKVTRLGSTKTTECDVRIIAATNRNLSEYVQEKKFRLDLYYRLNVIKLELLSLRNRKDDIPILINYFLSSFSRSFNKDVYAVSPEALRLLEQYSWPGNVRELRNVIEFSVNLAKSGVITIEDLPKDIRLNYSGDTFHKSPQNNMPIVQDINFYDSYEQQEKDMIKYLMFKYKGNKSLVAEELGMARSTLYRKLSKIDS